MPKKKQYKDHDLSRRERQIMSAVYRLGPSAVTDIVANIPEPPTADAVRRLCHILEEKGHLKGKTEGTRKIYHPTIESSKAQRGALDNVMETFFGGSPHSLVATLLDAHADQLSKKDAARLQAMVDAAEKKDKGA